MNTGRHCQASCRKQGIVGGGCRRFLSQEGADPKVLDHLFKVVFQAMLLFGEDTWVMTPRMERDLISFQHRVAQRLIRRQNMRWVGGS